MIDSWLPFSSDGGEQSGGADEKVYGFRFRSCLELKNVHSAFDAALRPSTSPRPRPGSDGQGRDDGPTRRT